MADETTTTTVDTEENRVPLSRLNTEIEKRRALSTEMDTLKSQLAELQGKASGWQAAATEAETYKTQAETLQAQLAETQGKHSAVTAMLRAGVDDNDMHDFLLTKHKGAGEEAGDFPSWFGKQVQEPPAFLAPFLRPATTTETTTTATQTAAPVNGNGAGAVTPVKAINDPVGGQGASPVSGGKFEPTAISGMSDKEWDENKDKILADLFPPRR